MACFLDIFFVMQHTREYSTQLVNSSQVEVDIKRQLALHDYVLAFYFGQLRDASAYITVNDSFLHAVGNIQTKL